MSINAASHLANAFTCCEVVILFRNVSKFRSDASRNDTAETNVPLQPSAEWTIHQFRRFACNTPTTNTDHWKYASAREISTRL